MAAAKCRQYLIFLFLVHGGPHASFALLAEEEKQGD